MLATVFLHSLETDKHTCASEHSAHC